MAKQRKSNSKYTNAIRQRNKKRKLEKRISKLTDETSIANVIKSCRIGRKAEGFQSEAFKKNKSKVFVAPTKEKKNADRK